jgi:fatty-acyl-CoA synthase
MIQTYDAAMASGACRWQLPNGMRSLVGGSAGPVSRLRAFAKSGVTLKQGWGMTETSPLASVSYLRHELQDAGDDERFKCAATAGVPVPLVDLRIRCDDGSDAATDGKTMGELQVRGPYITASYFGVEPSPDKFTEDGWLRTGDVATMNALGYIRITDRTKDLIKSGGEWISSVDLENALMAHAALAEAAVIAVPHEKWGERPLACVVLKAGTHATAADLARELDALLLETGFATWQLPDRYEVLDALPRTSTGKFYKLALRQRFPR